MKKVIKDVIVGQVIQGTDVKLTIVTIIVRMEEHAQLQFLVNIFFNFLYLFIVDNGKQLFYS